MQINHHGHSQKDLNILPIFHLKDWKDRNNWVINPYRNQITWGLLLCGVSIFTVLSSELAIKSWNYFCHLPVLMEQPQKYLMSWYLNDIWIVEFWNIKLYHDVYKINGWTEISLMIRKVETGPLPNTGNGELFS